MLLFQETTIPLLFFLSCWVSISRAYFSAVKLYLWSYVTVVFAADPTFDVPVVNVTVVQGAEAVLPCTVDNLGDHKVMFEMIKNKDPYPSHNP